MTNFNMSKIHVWNFFALVQNSQSHCFLLELLDFAFEISLSKSKCASIFTQQIFASEIQ